MSEQIKGYHYGQAGQSPVSMVDLDLLKKTVLFTQEDEKNLRLAGEVLKDQTNEVLDLWYGFVGGNDHLVHYFAKNGQPDMNYLTAVRARFGQWIMDLCNRPYDQDWLNYQHEIALRHHSTKKNVTDAVDTVPIIHYRYLVAFIFPVTATKKISWQQKGIQQKLLMQCMQHGLKQLRLQLFYGHIPTSTRMNFNYTLKKI